MSRPLPLLVILLTLPLVLQAAPPTTTTTSPTSTTLTIDLASPHAYPFRGWGTSLAWWAHAAGAWPDASVDEIVRLVTHPTEGLGLTVFRYNIGGGDHPTHHHMRRWGDIPGYKPAPDSPYDFNADAAQRNLLLRLVAASSSPPIVEAFSNSPPHWMTASGCVAGSVDGGPNLKPEFEQPFADYLATVAAHFRDTHHLTFHSLEPLNEPDANWWKAGKQQEGCHVPRDQQARLIRLTRAALDNRGLTQTQVSATDANSIDDCLRSLHAYDPTTLAALGQINTHSYSGSKRPDLRALATKLNKPLWQSETGPLYVGGDGHEQILKVAHRIARDLNDLRPDVWCTWQIIDKGPWGALHELPNANRARPAPTFHMLAAFTRPIRPGHLILPLPNTPNILAATTPTRTHATVILINGSKSPHTFNLTLKFPHPLPTNLTATTNTFTRTAPTLTATAPIPLTNASLRTTTPPESVTRLNLVFKP